MKRKVQYNVPCTTVPFSLRVAQTYHTVQQIVSKCRERGKYAASAPIGSNSNGGRHFSICSFSSQTMHILFFVSARLLLVPLFFFLQPLCTLHSSSSSSPSSLRDRVFFFSLDLDGWCHAGAGMGESAEPLSALFQCSFVFVRQTAAIALRPFLFPAAAVVPFSRRVHSLCGTYSLFKSIF